MRVYQVSKKWFFLSHGCDYAAPVDVNEDIKIFTSRKKAEKAFKELVNSYAEEYKAEPKVIYHIGLVYWATEIKEYDRRMIIEFSEKDTL